jgi:hypothetical protein
MRGRRNSLSVLSNRRERTGKKKKPEQQRKLSNMRQTHLYEISNANNFLKDPSGARDECPTKNTPSCCGKH